MEDIFSIMQKAFSQEFYLDKRSIEDNHEYIFELTKMALDICGDRDYTYEQIANCIWKLDSQLKEILIPEVETILPLFFKVNLPWKEIYNNNFERLLTLNRYEKERLSILFLTKSYEEFLLGYRIWRILKSWPMLNQLTRDIIIKGMIDCNIGIKDINEQIWVYDVSDDRDIDETYRFLALAGWIAQKVNKKINHQKKQFVKILAIYEKNKMYDEIFNNLSYEIMWEDGNSAYSKILNRAYGISLHKGQKIENAFNEVMLPWMRESDENAEKWLNTTFQYSVVARRCMIQALDNDEQIELLINDKKSKEEKQNRNIEKQKEYIRELEYINQNNERKIDELKDKLNIILEKNEKELVSLRNYLFKSQKEDIEIKSFKENCAKDHLDYSKVAIIGGHIRWQKKIQEELQGVTVINIDQHIKDMSFLNKMNLVVFVVGYLSHSFYYRAMDYISKDQGIIYINVRNINHLKKEIDQELIKLQNNI